MTIRTRILLVYLVVVGGGFYYLVNRSLGELRPRYLESMEEALVDTAHLLAAVVEHETGNGPIQADTVRATFSGALNARDTVAVDTPAAAATSSARGPVPRALSLVSRAMPAPDKNMYSHTNR